MALPGLLETIESILDYCEVIEVEPQTFWRQDNEGKFSVDLRTLERVKSWNKPITLHGVGTPVGGTVFAIDKQLDPLLKSIDILEPLWISEHLSFNLCPEREQFTGFFLPPIQTEEAAEVAAANLSRFRESLGIPVAFETGVNYFPKDKHQMSDGEFFRAIAEQADCDIVLDIHNLWCNERNGRDSLDRVLRAIPFERVCEMHVAGGDSYFGYYLDSHSRLPDPHLLTVLEKLVLPSVKNRPVTIFEITSTNYMANGINRDDLASVLKRLNSYEATESSPEAQEVNEIPEAIAPRTTQSLLEWEQSVVDQLFSDHETIKKRQIPGIELYRRLIDSNRLGILTNLCTLTVRLCIKVLGADEARKFFQTYLDQSYPAFTAEQEARQFVRHVEGKEIRPAWLISALQVDMARVEVSNLLRAVTVTIEVNPDVLFNTARNGLSSHLEPDGKTYVLELEP